MTSTTSNTPTHILYIENEKEFLYMYVVYKYLYVSGQNPVSFMFIRNTFSLQILII